MFFCVWHFVVFKSFKWRLVLLLKVGLPTYLNLTKWFNTLKQMSLVKQIDFLFTLNFSFHQVNFFPSKSAPTLKRSRKGKHLNLEQVAPSGAATALPSAAAKALLDGWHRTCLHPASRPPPSYLLQNWFELICACRNCGSESPNRNGDLMWDAVENWIDSLK